MSSTPITRDEFARILDDLGEEFIDVAEAVRRFCILDDEPDRFNCGTCQLLMDGECHIPRQPPIPMDPMSARCGRYEWRDPHADALPVGAVVARKNNSKMFK